MTHLLTQELRDKFERDGYICLRNFFSDAEVARLRQISTSLGEEATQVLAEAVRQNTTAAVLASKNPDSLIVVPEATDRLKVCRFEYILRRSPDLNAIITDRVLPVLQDLGKEPFVAFKDKENEKHPGGGAFTPHQDYAAYQYFDPKFQISVAVSIDPCTKENGCLQFSPNWRSVVSQIPGAVEKTFNGRPLLNFVRGGAMNGDIRPDVSSKLSWEFIETTSNDLVLFDSFAPHQSFKNNSKASRRVLLLTFSPESEGNAYDTYYNDKRKNFNHPKFHVSTPTQHSALSLVGKSKL